MTTVQIPTRGEQTNWVCSLLNRSRSLKTCQFSVVDHCPGRSKFEFLLRIVIAIGLAGVAIPTALTTTSKVIAVWG